jgi:hypothetical protein
MMHGFALLLTSILAIPWIAGVVKRATAAITYFRNSHYPLGLLRAAAKARGVLGSLASPCATRMTSIERALQSLVDLERAVFDVLQEKPQLLLRTSDGKADNAKHRAIREDLENPDFWRDVKRVVAVLQPISRVIMAVQADAITISDVARYWLYLAKELQEPLARTGQKEVMITAAAAFNARAKEMDAPLNRLALLLDPRFKHLANVSNAQHGDANDPGRNIFKLLAATGGEVLKKRGYGREAFLRFHSQLQLYVGGAAPFDGTCGSDSGAVKFFWKTCSISPHAAELSHIALLLRDVCPHAAALERIFSLFGLIQTDVRNRLHARSLHNIATVKEYYTQQRSGGVQRLKVPKGLELGKPAAPAQAAPTAPAAATPAAPAAAAADPDVVSATAATPTAATATSTTAAGPSGTSRDEADAIDHDDLAIEEPEALNEDQIGCISEALAKAAAADEALQRERHAVKDVVVSLPDLDQMRFQDLLNAEDVFGYYDFLTDPLVPAAAVAGHQLGLTLGSDSDRDFNPFEMMFEG